MVSGAHPRRSIKRSALKQGHKPRMAIARILLMLALVLTSLPSTADRLRVAVAANFKPTLETLTEAFESATGHTVVLSSASSGVLATQIMQGAPFDIFFSADRAAPERALLELGLPDKQLFCYARGQLVLLSKTERGLAALNEPDITLAIANPATAPYGRAAMEVLSRDEFQGGTPRKLVRGNNAIQAYQFWHTGSVNAAIVPRSLIEKDAGYLLPQAWHEPIDQYALVVSQRPAVDAYIAWLRSDNVRSGLQNAGYLPCP